jgi:hypothetical protein
MSYAELLKTPAILGTFAAGEADEYGDQVETYTYTPVLCHLAKAASTETAENVSGEQWTVYLPAGLVLDSTAQLIIDGQPWELDGEPLRALNPRTGATVQSCLVRRATA